MSKKSIIIAAVTILGAIAAFVAPSYANQSANSACLNGSIRQDFVIDWGADKRSGVVRTKNNKPLCKDTPLMVSTFTLPTNYDGKGWWLYDQNKLNPTVVPQTLYKTERFTMKAGTNGNIAFKTEMNPECGRWVQTDAYVGNDEITQIIGKGGIEDRIIQGQITKNPDCQEPPKEEPPVVKDIEVCRLSDKKMITIKENEFDSTKHSKNPDDCKEVPVVKDIEVCRLADKKMVTIKENEFDSTKYSKVADDCKEAPKEEPPVVKNIEVCRFADKKMMTIKENEFDGTKYSKLADDCKETPKEEPKPVIKDIEVCILETKDLKTIKENEFDDKTMSMEAKDCETVAELPKETPAPEVKAPAPGKGASVTELPHTGLGLTSTGIAISTLAGATMAYLRSRK